MNQKKKKIALAVVLLSVAVGAGFYWLEKKAEEGPLVVSGTMEATSVRVSAQVGGTVMAVEAREGQRIGEGEVVCRIDPTPYQLHVEEAEAALQGVAARLEELKAGARAQEIGQAQAAVERLEAVLAGAVKSRDYWADNLARLETLGAQGAVTEQELKDARSQYDNWVSQVQGAEAELAGARARLALVREGATAQALAQLEAARDQAQKAVELARYNLDKTTVKAPAAGTVALVSLEAGEGVNQGATVATILDLERLWIYVYVPEIELGRIALGQQAQVKVDAYPGEEFLGEVTYIASEAEFTPKNVQTVKDRVKTVFKVKVELKEGQGRLKPGMPADVVF